MPVTLLTPVLILKILGSLRSQANIGLLLSALSHLYSCSMYRIVAVIILLRIETSVLLLAELVSQGLQLHTSILTKRRRAAPFRPLSRLLSIIFPAARHGL